MNIHENYENVRDASIFKEEQDEDDDEKCMEVVIMDKMRIWVKKDRHMSTGISSNFKKKKFWVPT